MEMRDGQALWKVKTDAGHPKDNKGGLDQSARGTGSQVSYRGAHFQTYSL
jgi:hypothetical protein